jgi:hypothetical protein
MTPEIIIFRSNTSKRQSFENARVHRPKVFENNSLSIMSPKQLNDMLHHELNDICKDSIDETYIRDAIRKAHFFLVAFDHKRQEICGLLLLHMYDTWSPKFKTHAFGYIDLVCSRCPSFGKRLIASSERLCKDAGCLFVRLNAVSSKVAYYASLGYEHKVQPCDRSSLARPWTFVRDRRNISGQLEANDLGVKMAKCL